MLAVHTFISHNDGLHLPNPPNPTGPTAKWTLPQTRRLITSSIHLRILFIADATPVTLTSQDSVLSWGSPETVFVLFWSCDLTSASWRSMSWSWSRSCGWCLGLARLINKTDNVGHLRCSNRFWSDTQFRCYLLTLCSWVLWMQILILLFLALVLSISLQCSDTVGWATGRTSGR